MIESVGGFVGGLGLFFVGMWLLSESLKRLATRRIRIIASYWAPNRYAALGWGALAGGVIQSMAAMTFIAVGFMRANLVSTERALAFVLGGNLGASLLVLLVSLDIQLAAFYVLGISGILMVSKRAVKFRNLGTVLFGAALMFVGLGLVKESAASLATEPLFEGFLGVAGESSLLAFAGAVVLAILVQSSVAVMVFAVSMGSIGVLSADQIYMAIYGSFLGSSITLVAMSWNLSGESRRVAMFQVGYNLLLIVIFVPLLYIELWTGVPLVKSLILSVPLEQPMALLSLTSDVVGVTLVVFLLPGVLWLFGHLWPATEEETFSRAHYIRDRNYENVAGAIELIALEQQRVLSGFSSYLEAVRQGTGFDLLRDSIRSLILEIDEFLTEVRVRHPGYSIERINSALAQQRLIVWLEEQFFELCQELRALPDEEGAGQLRAVLVESIDAVVLVIIDGFRSRDPEDWSMLARLTGDRTELLRNLQGHYTPGNDPGTEDTQARVVKITNTAGEIFFLFSRLTREMASTESD